ncbi:LOW QUALITY PROTEIN: helicase SRCAP [Anomaloglossus baeobatrachus]
MEPSPRRHMPASDVLTSGVPPMSPDSSGELSPFDLSGDIGDICPGSPADGLDGNQQDNSAGQKWDNHTEIAEQAKHEAEIENRIAELRKEGFWTPRRLSKFPEPSRPKVHWDYLCEEMQWLSADFGQERRWKRGVARKVVRMVVRHHEELKQKEERARREEQAKLRRIATSIAKEVRQFWSNVEKVVQFKQQSPEEKRKKALDLQLDFIVGQTEKYSDLLSQSLSETLPVSKTSSSCVGSSQGGSLRTSPTPSICQKAADGDDDFPFEVEAEEDDEETIEMEEQQEGNDAEAHRLELELLRQESELPLDQLLQNLPPEILRDDSPVQCPVSSEDDTEEETEPGKEEDEDDEFTINEDEAEDEEDTIAAEEEMAGKQDHAEELSQLAREGEMSLEELLLKYSVLPPSDQQIASLSGPDSVGSEDYDSSDGPPSDCESEGVEFLVKQDEDDPGGDHLPLEPPEPKKEITDIAATAESLQPKGYTLATTQVKTAVPFLLRGELREYQHIGLEWLVTMYEKKLNGILADEMGLGKTIQTISLLAHLACERGNWGPLYLYIVPTSVILNWEMELKRWCPSFKILTYYGSQKERKLKRQGWTKSNAFHVCITSYKLVLQDHQAFRRKNWKYLILDEAQNIKNFKSQRWQSLLNFNSQRRLLLTGTPLQNSLMELWSLMHFLMPHVFQSHREFKEWFSNPLTGMIEGSQEYNEGLVRRLHKVLRPFLLRRIKLDVEKQMPKKYEHVIYCRLSKRQRFLYDDFMAQAATRETLASGHFMSVINILMQLRKVCNHPNLFDPRPIHSPFITHGICYTVPSLVLHALQRHPLEHMDMSLFDFINMEGRVSRYERDVFLPQYKQSRSLIQEIADSPEPPPRPRTLKMKVNRMLQPVKPDPRSVVVNNSRLVQKCPDVLPPAVPPPAAPQPVASSTCAPPLPGLKVPLPVQCAPAVTPVAPVSIGAVKSVPVQNAPPMCAAPQRLILTPEMQARLPSGEVISLAQLASLGGRPLQSQSVTKPLTLQLQGAKLTLSGPPVRPLGVGQPRSLQGNVLHLVSSGGQHHLLSQPTQLALIQALAQQAASPAPAVPQLVQNTSQAQIGVQAMSVQSLQHTLVNSAGLPAASPGQVPSPGVVKIVVRQSTRDIPASPLHHPVAPTVRPLLRVVPGPSAEQSTVHKGPAPVVSTSTLTLATSPLLMMSNPTLSTRLPSPNPSQPNIEESSVPPMSGVALRLLTTSAAVQLTNHHSSPPIHTQSPSLPNCSPAPFQNPSISNCTPTHTVCSDHTLCPSRGFALDPQAVPNGNGMAVQVSQPVTAPSNSTDGALYVNLIPNPPSPPSSNISKMNPATPTYNLSLVPALLANSAPSTVSSSYPIPARFLTSPVSLLALSPLASSSSGATPVLYTAPGATAFPAASVSASLPLLTAPVSFTAPLPVSSSTHSSLSASLSVEAPSQQSLTVVSSPSPVMPLSAAGNLPATTGSSHSLLSSPAAVTMPLLSAPAALPLLSAPLLSSPQATAPRPLLSVPPPATAHLPLQSAQSQPTALPLSSPLPLLSSPPPATAPLPLQSLSPPVTVPLLSVPSPAVTPFPLLCSPIPVSSSAATPLPMLSIPPPTVSAPFPMSIPPASHLPLSVSTPASATPVPQVSVPPAGALPLPTPASATPFPQVSVPPASTLPLPPPASATPVPQMSVPPAGALPLPSPASAAPFPLVSVPPAGALPLPPPASTIPVPLVSVPPAGARPLPPRASATPVPLVSVPPAGALPLPPPASATPFPQVSVPPASTLPLPPLPSTIPVPLVSVPPAGALPLPPASTIPVPLVSVPPTSALPLPSPASAAPFPLVSVPPAGARPLPPRASATPVPLVSVSPACALPLPSHASATPVPLVSSPAPTPASLLTATASFLETSGSHPLILSSDSASVPLREAFSSDSLSPLVLNTSLKLPSVASSSVPLLSASGTVPLLAAGSAKMPIPVVNATSAPSTAGPQPSRLLCTPKAGPLPLLAAAGPSGVPGDPLSSHSILIPTPIALASIRHPAPSSCPPSSTAVPAVMTKMVTLPSVPAEVQTPLPADAQATLLPALEAAGVSSVQPVISGFSQSTLPCLSLRIPAPQPSLPVSTQSPAMPASAPAPMPSMPASTPIPLPLLPASTPAPMSSLPASSSDPASLLLVPSPAPDLSSSVSACTQPIDPPSTSLLPPSSVSHPLMISFSAPLTLASPSLGVSAHSHIPVLAAPVLRPQSPSAALYPKPVPSCPGPVTAAESSVLPAASTTANSPTPSVNSLLPSSVQEPCLSLSVADPPTVSVTLGSAAESDGTMEDDPRPLHNAMASACVRPRRQLPPPPRSPFYLEPLEERRRKQKLERLDRILHLNERRSSLAPIYGTEVLQACTLHFSSQQTNTLRRCTFTSEQRLEQLAPIIERFIFAMPPVEAPQITLHTSHPPPSLVLQESVFKDTLSQGLTPHTRCLHGIISNMRTQFPDLRLIQYDCGKLQTMDRLLRQLKSGGHRVLIFTQMTRMLDVLEQFLNYHGHIYVRLDGSTRVEQRQVLMERFNMDKRIFCFILSTRSGGVGVNLTGADTVIFYDSDWNPTMDAQAQDRCHRIGQTRDVHIYRLVSERTVEENILKKAQQKRLLGDMAIEGGNFTTAYFKQQTIRELFDMEDISRKEVEVRNASPDLSTEEGATSRQAHILEQALCGAEDEEDTLAASLVRAEQVADLAEFNENVPLEPEEEEQSRAEQEISALVEQLTPIERYAMYYLEASLEEVSKEELKQAEEQVEAARKDLFLAKDEAGLMTEEKWDEENRRNRKVKTPVPNKPPERVGVRMSERLRGSRPIESLDHTENLTIPDTAPQSQEDEVVPESLSPTRSNQDTPEPNAASPSAETTATQVLTMNPISTALPPNGFSEEDNVPEHNKKNAEVAVIENVADMDCAPGSPVSAAPGSPVSAAPGSPVSAAPGSPVSAAPGSPVSAAPGSPVSAAPGSPVSAAQGSPVSAAPGSPVSAAPGSPVSAAPGSPVSAAPGSPVSAAPGSPVSAAPGSPVPPRSPGSAAPSSPVPPRSPGSAAPSSPVPPRSPGSAAPSSPVPPRSPGSAAPSSPVPPRSPVSAAPSSPVPARSPVSAAPSSPVPPRTPRRKVYADSEITLAGATEDSPTAKVLRRLPGRLVTVVQEWLPASRRQNKGKGCQIETGNDSQNSTTPGSHSPPHDRLSEEISETSSPPPKRKRGRPPKPRGDMSPTCVPIDMPSVDSSTHPSADLGTAQRDTIDLMTTSVVVQTPGSPNRSFTVSSEIENGSPIEKRKRGRPPKRRAIPMSHQKLDATPCVASLATSKLCEDPSFASQLSPKKCEDQVGEPSLTSPVYHHRDSTPEVLGRDTPQVNCSSVSARSKSDGHESSLLSGQSSDSIIPSVSSNIPMVPAEGTSSSGVEEPMSPPKRKRGRPPKVRPVFQVNASPVLPITDSSPERSPSPQMTRTSLQRKCKPLKEEPLDPREQNSYLADTDDSSEEEVTVSVPLTRSARTRLQSTSQTSPVVFPNSIVSSKSPRGRSPHTAPVQEKPPTKRRKPQSVSSPSPSSSSPHGSSSESRKRPCPPAERVLRSSRTANPASNTRSSRSPLLNSSNSHRGRKAKT